MSSYAEVNCLLEAVRELLESPKKTGWSSFEDEFDDTIRSELDRLSTSKKSTGGEHLMGRNDVSVKDPKKEVQTKPGQEWTHRVSYKFHGMHMPNDLIYKIKVIKQTREGPDLYLTVDYDLIEFVDTDDYGRRVTLTPEHPEFPL